MRFKAEIILRSIYLSLEKLPISGGFYHFAIITSSIVKQTKGDGLMPVLLLILGCVLLFGIGFHTVLDKIVKGIIYLFKKD